MAEPTPQANQLAQLAQLPQWAQLLLILTATGSGVSALGLQFGQQEPPATQEEVKVLRAEVQGLKDALRELAFEIRLHHQEKD